MSMTEHAMLQPLNPDDAFLVTLLVTCEVVKNVLAERASDTDKRRYYIDRLDKDIEGINRTFAGYLPESFQHKAEKYHKQIEASMNWLLKDYHADLRQDARR